MSITGALNNAISGLRAAGRGSELVSSNIANALTPGYGRRLLELSSSAIGDFGGVKIDGITRLVNEGLIADRRSADAQNAEAQTTLRFLTRLEGVVGSPDDPFAISGRLAKFESGLISAASRPDAPERLSGSVNDARNLAGSLQTASNAIQNARTDADRAIAVEVNNLNRYLGQIEQLNSQITAVEVRGGDDATLRDERQQIVDEISKMVPVKSVPRDNGQIALYSDGGAVLLDGTALEVEFEPVNVVTAYQTQSAGHLSGITIAGIPVGTDSQTGVLRGGSISGHFEIRDELGVEAQAKVDAIARDLIERYQDPSIDPTLSLGDAGLFTDGGLPFLPTNEIGIASRISINAAVDPNQGGEASRLRDGIGAVATGNVGNATILNALRDALTTSRTPLSGGFGSGAYTASNLISTFASEVGASLTAAEQTVSFSTSRLQELTERQLADGVDTDTELQNLMVLERAYAANARVIETVDEMMQTIMRL